MSDSPARPKTKWDALVPVGIIGVVLMMILPLPPALLDGLFSLSMALSIGVFLTALFIEQPLEFSAFPAFVLFGYTVVDRSTIIATHLGEVLRAQGHRLVGRQEVQHLLDVLARRAPRLVEDVVPTLLPLGDLVRVLRNLVREGISIRDLRTILEALAELAGQTKDAEQLTELVRERLAPQITARLRNKSGSITALTLDPRAEQIVRTSLADIASGAGAIVSGASPRAA